MYTIGPINYGPPQQGGTHNEKGADGKIWSGSL